MEKEKIAIVKIGYQHFTCPINLIGLLLRELQPVVYTYEKGKWVYYISKAETVDCTVIALEDLQPPPPSKIAYEGDTKE